MRHCNEAGKAIIKERESLRLAAYLCPKGKPTIGWGHTRGVALGLTCTTEQAEAWLAEDLAETEVAVWERILVMLTSNQFSALVSWVFNVGCNAFACSTLLRKLNAGDYDAVPGELKRWNKVTVNGKKTVYRGLIIRREQEAALWLTK